MEYMAFSIIISFAIKFLDFNLLKVLVDIKIKTITTIARNVTPTGSIVASKSAAWD